MRKKEREKEEEEESRERSSTLTLDFPDDRTVGFRRSKKKSYSSRQELQVEIENEEFQQTPRGKTFSPTWFNSHLKVIQMFGMVGAGMVEQFSPKDLELKVGLRECL